MSETELRSAEGRTGPADDRPLTEQEFRMVQRLLSDPFAFPLAYKSWLVSYLETSDLNLPLSAVSGLTRLLGVSGIGTGTLGLLPAGIILPYGGDTAPTGSLLCDGASYLRTEQSRLFAAIGEKYGAADATHFYVPDLRERIPVGKGTVTAVDTLGKNEGLSVGQRGPHHAHPVGEHTHPAYRSNDVGTNEAVWVNGSDANWPSSTFPTGIQVGPGGNVPQDTPAFLTINFIIIN